MCSLRSYFKEKRVLWSEKLGPLGPVDIKFPTSLNDPTRPFFRTHPLKRNHSVKRLDTLLPLLHLYLYSNVLDIGICDVSGVQAGDLLEDFELEVMHVSVPIACSLQSFDHVIHAFRQGQCDLIFKVVL